MQYPLSVADLLGERLVDHIVEIWMKTAFEGGRHQRRLDKIKEIGEPTLLTLPKTLP